MKKFISFFSLFKKKTEPKTLPIDNYRNNDKRVFIQTEMKFDVVFVLNEKEAKALDALAGYGTDPFLEVFYKSMGRHYLSPHEAGLRSLFEKIKDLSYSFGEIERAKKIVKDAKEGKKE